MQSAREALHLAAGIFEIPFDDLLQSTRVLGVAVQELGRSDVIRQRSPLSVAMVEALESHLNDENADAKERVLAGAGFFVLFCRTHVGDTAKSTTEHGHGEGP